MFQYVASWEVGRTMEDHQGEQNQLYKTCTLISSKIRQNTAHVYRVFFT